MAIKKAPLKALFLLYNCKNVSYYRPPPVVNVPIVLVNAVPMPVPCGVCTALSYLTDNVIVAGSDVL